MVPYAEFSLGASAMCGGSGVTGGFGYASTFTEVGFEVDVNAPYAQGDQMTLGFTGWASGSTGLVSPLIEVSDDNAAWHYVGAFPARNFLGGDTRDEVSVALPMGGDRLYVRLASDIKSKALIFVRGFDAVVHSCPEVP